MITGELKSKVDKVWDACWSGGISNPLDVIEQVTFLLFIKRLDELQTLEDRKVARVGGMPERTIFTHEQQELRWSHFHNLAPEAMFDLVDRKVFPFLRELGTTGSSFAQHMKDARLGVPTPALLAKLVDLVDDIPMQDRDTKGDLYEYMLSKLNTAGTNGQFRTARHIIKLMVELIDPKPGDEICDPAVGTAGFLTAASEHVREKYPEVLRDEKLRKHFHEQAFHGFDFDSKMLRIASMNMLLHGVEQPAIEYRDSLAESHAGVAGAYSVILANPPFAGSLDYEGTAKDLQQIVKTKKTELLFLALFLRLLNTGGRAAVIVPDGVLFGSSKAHKRLREILVDEQKLDAVISMPSGVFKPYSGVSTAILLFTKTDSGGTDTVWFYDMHADGWSLDDKRMPLVDEDKLGAVPVTPLAEGEYSKNNLPDIVARWAEREGSERERERTAQSFAVSREEIAANDYDLSLNRYHEIEYEKVEHRDPLELIAELRQIENEIRAGLDELAEMLA